jgi:hypothetical protein
MYPSRELNVLAERRAYLQRRIALRRETCVAAGEAVAGGVERMMLWARLLRAGTLVGAIGAGWIALRRRRPPPADEDTADTPWGTKVLLWAPLVLRAARLVSSLV